MVLEIDILCMMYEDVISDVGQIRNAKFLVIV